MGRERINDRLNLHSKDGENKGKKHKKVCKFRRSYKLTHYGNSSVLLNDGAKILLIFCICK